MEQESHLHLIQKFNDMPLSRLESDREKTNRKLAQHKRQEHRGCFDYTCQRCRSLDELFKLQSQVLGGRRKHRQN